jgi:hypothetical protein
MNVKYILNFCGVELVGWYVRLEMGGVEGAKCLEKRLNM